MDEVDINSLPEPVRKALREAFEATGAMDLYEGDAVKYLAVIRQSLEMHRLRLEVFKDLTVRACGVFGFNFNPD